MLIECFRTVARLTWHNKVIQSPNLLQSMSQRSADVLLVLMKSGI